MSLVSQSTTNLRTPRPIHDRYSRQAQNGEGKLSKTNLYIKSLPLECDDEYLRKLCKPFGEIVSTKAILDPNGSNRCKGYGFVDFENEECALNAVRELNKQQIPAQMAKQQEQDPTNLYFSGLPPELNESNLEEILFTFGTVISTRILRDQETKSKGVGFARMESSLVCDKIIKHFHKVKFSETIETLSEKNLGFAVSECSNVEELIICKLADGGTKRRNNKYKNAVTAPLANILWPDMVNVTGGQRDACDIFGVGNHGHGSNGGLNGGHNILLEPNLNHLVSNNLLNVSGSPRNLVSGTRNTINGISLANTISSATPILNGPAALAAIQQHEQHRQSLSLRQQQQTALLQSCYLQQQAQNKANQLNQSHQNQHPSHHSQQSSFENLGQMTAQPNLNFQKGSNMIFLPKDTETSNGSNGMNGTSSSASQSSSSNELQVSPKIRSGPGALGAQAQQATAATAQNLNLLNAGLITDHTGCAIPAVIQNVQNPGVQQNATLQNVNLQNCNSFSTSPLVNSRIAYQVPVENVTNVNVNVNGVNSVNGLQHNQNLPNLHQSVPISPKNQIQNTSTTGLRMTPSYTLANPGYQFIIPTQNFVPAGSGDLSTLSQGGIYADNGSSQKGGLMRWQNNGKQYFDEQNFVQFQIFGVG